LAENKPWNTMVYELVTASGASRPNKMDVPFNGATNFMLAHLGDRTMPNVPATSFTTRLFLGVQVQCTQCHDHPFNERKQDSFWGINAFFHQMQKQDFNDTSDTGQRIFLFSELKDKPLGPDDDLFVRYDKRNGLVEVTPPRWLDGTKIADVSAELNLRQRLADFITDKDNPYFAQAIVNRMWAHFLGRGIVHPLDDLGEHNTPSNPELLERLAKHFVESNYDLKRLASWITLSMPYALSSKVSATNKEDESLFSHFPLKQMSPEQFFDSLMIASRADRVGAKSPEEVYKLKEALLAQFTTVFGNDEDREADSFNGTIPQALLLMNGDLMAKAISKQPGSYLRESVDEILNAKKAKKKLRDPDAALLDDLYVAAFSRYPTKLEQQTAMKLVRATLAQSKEKDPIDAYQDIFWALLNSSEFVLNH
jgi:hypothetical protein